MQAIFILIDALKVSTDWIILRRLLSLGCSVHKIIKNKVILLYNFWLLHRLSTTISQLVVDKIIKMASLFR